MEQNITSSNSDDVMTFTIIEDNEQAQELQNILESQGLTVAFGTTQNWTYFVGISEEQYNALEENAQSDIIQSINNTYKSAEEKYDTTNEQTASKQLCLSSDFKDVCNKGLYSENPLNNADVIITQTGPG